jgi:hypothetical protein
MVVIVAVAVGVMVVVMVVIGAWQRQIIYKKVLEEIHARKLGRHVEDDGIRYGLGDSPYFRIEDLQTGNARRDLREVGRKRRDRRRIPNGGYIFVGILIGH